MTIWHRRILYIFCLLLFFILAPAVAFYAAGYEFEFSAGRPKVKRTGILIIKSEPKGARVDLGDNKKYNWLYSWWYGDKALATPLKLRNILPGEYNLTITKNDYFSYYKKINLDGGQTLVLDEINLLKKSAPEVIINQPVIKTALSPDKNKLAAVTAESLNIVDLNSGLMSVIPLDIHSSPSQNFEILWAPSGKKILLTLELWPIFNIESGNKEVELKKYAGGRAEKVEWDDFSDSYCWLLKQNSLYQFNLANKAYSAAMPARAWQDFLLKDGNIYALTGSSESGNEFLIYGKTEKNLIRSISLPGARVYEFKDLPGALAYIYEPKHEMLYLTSPASIFPLQDSLNNVRELTVANDHIFYWNDFEIWDYYLPDRNKKLIVRISQPIRQVAVTDYYNIYNTPTEVTGLERNMTDGQNIFTVLNWENTDGMTISPDGKNLYFTSPLGRQRALWRLVIK